MSGRCYDKAVELLSRRSHFSAELARKLTQRGFPSEEIESTLARLKEQGYINDETTAGEFVSARRARSGGSGSRKLEAELARRGVEGEAIASALAVISPEEELEAAREAAALWRRKGGTDRAALARHLDRKGYSRRAIYAVLDRSDDESS